MNIWKLDSIKNFHSHEKVDIDIVFQDALKL